MSDPMRLGRNLGAEPVRSAAIIVMALKAPQVRERWPKPAAPRVESEHDAPTCEILPTRVHSANSILLSSEVINRRCDVGGLP